MNNKQICYKNNYRDINNKLIINNCINNKHKNSEVCALFLNQENKIKFYDENTNLPVKGRNYLKN